MTELLEKKREGVLAKRSKSIAKTENILSGSRVYLSGPMDFVASRAEEKKVGWRNRITQFLHRYGTTVYDPWNKPDVAGMKHYGKEDEFSTEARYAWDYEGEKGDRVRAKLSNEFWATLHIDLRMTDTVDFLVAYCPTNIYSVGTVHEIVMARLQHKPVLFVSPPVTFPSQEELEEHMLENGDKKGQELLKKLVNEAPLRSNPKGIPSMWYMALVDAHYFFDGFGFEQYREEFNWEVGELDERERKFPPKRPLLPYLEKLNNKIPKKYDYAQKKYVENPEWLIFDTTE